MSFFTTGKVEFLSHLNGRWATLYRNELARLMREAYSGRDAGQPLEGVRRYEGNVIELWGDPTTRRSAEQAPTSAAIAAA